MNVFKPSELCMFELQISYNLEADVYLDVRLGALGKGLQCDTLIQPLVRFCVWSNRNFCGRPNAVTHGSSKLWCVCCICLH
jgi:hypothetical protein